MSFTQRTAYKIPIKQAKELILDCIKLSYKTHVDELDCSKSFCRIKTDKTLEEVLEIGFNNKNTLYIFIYRDPTCGEKEYYEVGFSTIGLTPEYFLWLSLTTEDGNGIIKKYKLKKL